MKYGLIVILSTLILSSCSNSDEPTPEVFSQVAEITNGKSESKTILYDDYGRVIKYVATFLDETVNSTYTYVGDNLIEIHTEHIIHGFLNGDNAIRQYEDELYLENGRATYCDGTFSTNQLGQGTIFQKKYRQEFLYTTDNHLNVIKNTEWNKKGDSWADDNPWTWETYYIWKDNNLITVEDYAGNEVPTYVYNYGYSSTTGVRNVLPIHWDRFQYFPLQLKGYFGSEPANLIISIERIRPDASNSEITYQYNISDNRIADYTEYKNEVSDKYSVTWVE